MKLINNKQLNKNLYYIVIKSININRTKRYNSIVNDKEQIALLKEIKRVLKPNGILYINDFLLNTDERNIERYKLFQDKYQKYGVFELPEGAAVRHHDIKWVEQCV